MRKAHFRAFLPSPPRTRASIGEEFPDFRFNEAPRPKSERKNPLVRATAGWCSLPGRLQLALVGQHCMLRHWHCFVIVLRLAIGVQSFGGDPNCVPILTQRLHLPVKR